MANVSAKNALSKAEQNATVVSYDLFGSHIELDMDFVKSYLVRGDASLITDQEAVFFMNTCRSQKLNPTVNGEVYLIKYSKGAPAQMVIGKDAYMRRAFTNPDYLFKNDGITVLRGNEIRQKEGCCLYPGETLVGGWCRVTYMRGGKERTAFKEVALSEYNSGMANWKSKPALMINKVAISQCVREAFPKDYEGLYSEEEMIASGAIKQSEIDAETSSPGPSDTNVARIPTKITAKQRKQMFEFAKNNFGDSANSRLLAAMRNRGYESSAELLTEDYEWIMGELQRQLNESDPNESDIEIETEASEVPPDDNAPEPPAPDEYPFN
ncbi:MAG: phage recombination protein Bet [Oscillospiraceae bacterium]|nr:phage recombination protein Bet [Oscillospiraceae bacterium]